MQKAETVLSILSENRSNLRNGWRAGYIERCLSGSEGGLWKPAEGQGVITLPYPTQASRRRNRPLQAHLDKLV